MGYHGLGLARSGLIAVGFTFGLAAAAIPEPWSQSDIGSVAVAGNASETGGTWTVSGSGADIWGNADAFRYVWRRQNGNVQIVVKVTSLQNQHSWSKAGIMFREDITPGSRHVSLFVTPAMGISFQSRSVANQASVSATVAGFAAPYWIKLSRSGSTFTAWRSPDNVTWTQVGAARTVDLDPVLHAGLAVTSHNNPVLSAATFTNLAFNRPPALLVAGSAMLNASDAAVKKRLETLGYAVTVKAAAASTGADAIGKDLVVISSTPASADVNTKFRTAAVPVILWENALLDDMGMTGTVNGTDFGTTAGQFQASIYPAACSRAAMYQQATGGGDMCHDMAAGLTGNVNVLRSAGTFSWGAPNANAIRIAYHAGNQARAVVFGYEKAAAMPGLAAPARRVFLFLEDNTAANWSPRGQALFDNAVHWATGTRYHQVRKVLVLNFDPQLASQANVRLHAFAPAAPAAPWNWKDPLPLVRDYLADITEASGGYVRWKWVFNAAIPAYLNQWIPITGGTQFNSPGHTEQNFIKAVNDGISTGNTGETWMQMPSSGFYKPDYAAILAQFGVDAKIQSGEVDEVLIASHPFSNLDGSIMAGGQSYELNGPIVSRPGVRNFVITGFNYGRGLADALEAFGHRAEKLLDRHVYHADGDAVFTLPYAPCIWPDFPVNLCGETRHPTPQRSIYDRFAAVEGVLAGSAGLGAARFPPNARTRQDEIAYGLAVTAYSMADDWQYNYPALAGPAARRLVDQAEWLPYAQNGDAGRGFLKWWMLHMPRVPGLYANDGNARNKFRLNNWWDYVVTPWRHPETRD